jgi:hypothetical protein
MMGTLTVLKGHGGEERPFWGWSGKCNIHPVPTHFSWFLLKSVLKLVYSRSV